ncbi:ABC transporter related protein [Xylanimonas cellulosilytica DSM 15894]|uniref:ABC transporter related protein n=1 Tax=Xylanimonas cellulosilytica (strain DSM 15894 / JCM 12276 / CECT 5975 / KCTC 9989 / LMG 20990 / NBRC 107835 / XIL07) TaxID=446471 RepID=D1BXP6_XYLCX|nr:ATP-binding cassette domain-containing protein [Xylanimonas cellulosilytica]ACZ31687.1 ABC transporter related protein [Xylanimonas cellulosilytica DSM 15894]
MIEAHGLTKRYGPKTAVDDITFTVRPGIVTGFLGPNGAGKSTTMRMIMGLDRPTAGAVTVNGHPYSHHKSPLTQVGALLEARAVHPGRSAEQHLRVLAATHGLPSSRVGEVIELTGLESVARKRVGGFSLGMGQRLGIASALLGDPATLILDEPVNGLDPEGVLWVRNLARYLAGQGRTVFLSSHLMSEVALTADHVIVIGRGKILADTSVKEFTSGASRRAVRVRTPGAAALVESIGRAGGTAVVLPSDDDGAAHGLLEVTGLGAPEIGELALTTGVVLHELTPVASTLEQAYMELTADSVEYRTEDVSHVDGATSHAGAPTPGTPSTTIPGTTIPGTTTDGEQR